ncbi:MULTISPECIES: sensor histidine kinase [Brevibacterium]|nr:MULTISPECIES: histidine kinase [Brevibacterium]
MASETTDPRAGAAHPRLVDLALALTLALVLTVVITADLEGTGRAGPGAYAFALGFGALLLARRRAPRTVLTVTVVAVFVYYIFDWPPIGIALPAVPALYSTAEAGWTRWSAGAGLALIAVAGYARLHEGLPAAYLYSYDLLTDIALAAAAIALAVSVRSRREIRAHEERERQRGIADQRREAQRRLQTERFRIARDLHDVIGHSISVIAVHSNVAAEAIGHDDARAAQAVERVRRAASETLHELRATVKLLRSADGEGVDRSAVGLAGLGRLFDEARDAGIDVVAQIAVDAEEVDAAVGTAVHRIVQESLTNVLRHSRSAVARVSLRPEHDRLLLTIADDGPAGPRPGVDDGPGANDRDTARASGGTGLEGMAERVRLLGGDLQAAPAPGGGFAVRALLPARLGS